jgi:hypothetical protein
LATAHISYGSTYAKKKKCGEKKTMSAERQAPVIGVKRSRETRTNVGYGGGAVAEGDIDGDGNCITSSNDTGDVGDVTHSDGKSAGADTEKREKKHKVSEHLDVVDVSESNDDIDSEIDEITTAPEKGFESMHLKDATLLAMCCHLSAGLSGRKKTMAVDIYINGRWCAAVIGMKDAQSLDVNVRAFASKPSDPDDYSSDGDGSAANADGLDSGPNNDSGGGAGKDEYDSKGDTKRKDTVASAITDQVEVAYVHGGSIVHSMICIIHLSVAGEHGESCMETYAKEEDGRAICICHIRHHDSQAWWSYQNIRLLAIQSPLPFPHDLNTLIKPHAERIAASLCIFAPPHSPSDIWSPVAHVVLAPRIVRDAINTCTTMSLLEMHRKWPRDITESGGTIEWVSGMTFHALHLLLERETAMSNTASSSNTGSGNTSSGNTASSSNNTATSSNTASSDSFNSRGDGSDGSSSSSVGNENTNSGGGGDKTTLMKRLSSKQKILINRPLIQYVSPLIAAQMAVFDNNWCVWNSVSRLPILTRRHYSVDPESPVATSFRDMLLVLLKQLCVQSSTDCDDEEDEKEDGVTDEDGNDDTVSKTRRVYKTIEFLIHEGAPLESHAEYPDLSERHIRYLHNVLWELVCIKIYLATDADRHSILTTSAITIVCDYLPWFADFRYKPKYIAARIRTAQLERQLEHFKRRAKTAESLAAQLKHTLLQLQPPPLPT